MRWSMQNVSRYSVSVITVDLFFDFISELIVGFIFELVVDFISELTFDVN